MSVPILSSIFGEKPNIVPFKPIDYGESQLKSILENLKAFPQIQALGDYFQKYMTDAYNKAIPNFSKLLEMGGESAESILKAAGPLLRGELPKDVQAAIMRSSAFKSLGQGADFIHSEQARQIGSNSLAAMLQGDAMVRSAGSATQQWAGLASGLVMNPAGFLVTPTQQANLDLQQSLIEREVKQAQENVNAAPNPIAKGLSDLVAYLTASYIGHGPAGKPPDATNYSSATGIGSQSYGTTAAGTEVFGPTSFQEIPSGGAGWDINAGPGNLQPPAETAGGPFGGITGWGGGTGGTPTYDPRTGSISNNDLLQVSEADNPWDFGGTGGGYPNTGFGVGGIGGTTSLIQQILAGLQQNPGNYKPVVFNQGD